MLKYIQEDRKNVNIYCSDLKSSVRFYRSWNDMLHLYLHNDIFRVYHWSENCIHSMFLSMYLCMNNMLRERETWTFWNVYYSS